MSSPSMRPGESRCPECGKGLLRRVVVSRTLEIEGQAVFVEGLMPDQCPECQSFVWPESEMRRAREQARIKLERKAA